MHKDTAPAQIARSDAHRAELRDLTTLAHQHRISAGCKRPIPCAGEQVDRFIDAMAPGHRDALLSAAVGELVLERYGLPVLPGAPARPGVLDSWPAWSCEHCGRRYCEDQSDHPCGPLTPVTVTVARRETTGGVVAGPSIPEEK